MRERLIELLLQYKEHPEKTCPEYGTNTPCEGCKYDLGEDCDRTGRFADHLLANGVICPPCNELKPEDVMRALECCKEYENDDCPEHCPLYECETCNMPLFVTILREKDEEIKRLTINMNAYGLTAKNLANDFADYQADVKMDIAAARAEAITEFAEKVKQAYPLISSVVVEGIDKIAEDMKGATDD
jgi:hypothetical protein